MTHLVVFFFFLVDFFAFFLGAFFLLGVKERQGSEERERCGEF